MNLGAGPSILYDLHSDELEIRVAHLFRFLSSKRLMIDLVRIEKPAISLLKHAITEDTMTTPFQFDPYRLIAPALNALRIKQVRIGDGRLSFREQDYGDELELHFDRFNLEAAEL